MGKSVPSHCSPIGMSCLFELLQNRLLCRYHCIECAQAMPKRSLQIPLLVQILSIRGVYQAPVSTAVVDISMFLS